MNVDLSATDSWLSFRFGSKKLEVECEDLILFLEAVFLLFLELGVPPPELWVVCITSACFCRGVIGLGRLRTGVVSFSVLTFFYVDSKSCLSCFFFFSILATSRFTSCSSSSVNRFIGDGVVSWKSVVWKSSASYMNFSALSGELKAEDKICEILPGVHPSVSERPSFS